MTGVRHFNSRVRPYLLLCWITLHLEEFQRQSEKNTIEAEPNCAIIALLRVFFCQKYVDLVWDEFQSKT